MYPKHFALMQHPFGPEIAPEDLLPSTTSRELDIRLAHLLDLRGGRQLGDLVDEDAPCALTLAQPNVLFRLGKVRQSMGPRRPPQRALRSAHTAHGPSSITWASPVWECSGSSAPAD